MIKLSVVVPCYNEEENIPLILARFDEVIDRNDVEVILVNNGSTDGSAGVLEELLPKYAFARTVLVEVNQAGMSLFETCYLHKKLYDINAQPNIFPKVFYDSWENPPYDFSLDLYALYMARKKKLRVVRFPVLFPERIHGSSKWNTGLQAKWKFIRRTIDFSVKLKKSGSL